MDEPTGGLDPPTAWSMCELGIKLRDLRDVAAIVVTHGIENVRFIASTYAVYGPNGEVMLLEEKDRRSVSEFVANNAHCSTEVIRIARTEQL